MFQKGYRKTSKESYKKVLGKVLSKILEFIAFRLENFSRLLSTSKSLESQSCNPHYLVCPDSKKYTKNRNSSEEPQSSRNYEVENFKVRKEVGAPST